MLSTCKTSVYVWRERSSFNEVSSKRLDPLMLLDRDVCINIQIAINVTPILEIDSKNNIFTND